MRFSAPIPRSRSFVSQVLLPFLVLFALVLALEGSVAYVGSKKAIERSVLRRLQTIAQLRKEELVRYLNDKKDLVGYLAHVEVSNGHAAAILSKTTANTENLKSETVSRFSYWTDHTENVLSIGLIDTGKGILVASTGPSFAKRDGGKIAIRHNGINNIVVELIRSDNSEDFGFIELAAPVTDANTSLIGLVVAHIDLRYIASFLSPTSDESSDIRIIAVDAEGVPLIGGAGVQSALHDGTVPTNEIADGSSWSGEYISNYGQPVIGYFSGVDELGIRLVVEITMESALASTRTIGLIFLGTAVVLVILLIPGGYFVSRRIARPILALTEASVRITEGDLSTRVPILSSDEIGIMARSFNDMIERLSTLYDALRSSEERFRTLFHASPDAVMVVAESDGTIVNANEGCVRITGYADLDLTGIRLSDVDLFVSESELSDLFISAMSAGHVTIETRIMRKDGSFANASVSARFVTLREGPHLVLVIRDLTELRTAQFELERYQEGLEDLVRERTHQLENAQTELVKTEGLAVLGRLTATVSHEIRNPLGTIRNGVFSMVNAAEKNDKERLVRSQALVDRNIERCDRILSELLRYAERKAPILERMPLDTWVELSIGRMEIPESINVDLRKGCPEQIAIDRSQMFTALQNIVSNSVDAISELQSDGGTISVNTYVDAGRAWIRLADSGPGIQDRDIGRIFEPLFSTKTYGVGLGLSVTRSIIEAHGGKVKISLTVDGGTEVRVSLPLAIDSRYDRNNS